MSAALPEAAIAYALRGMAVFPLRPREKMPYGRTGGLHMASADPALARMRWAGVVELPLKTDGDDRRPVRAGPHSNIGVATGAASALWVLDLDGPEAEAALAALEAEHGALPRTWSQSTGKGRHLLFAWDAAARPVRNSASRIGPKIDVRGEGGYILAAPSVHPSGRRYAWVAGLSPGECDLAAAPDWLLALAAPAEPELAPVAPAADARPRLARDGRATAWGEACLSTACRMIAQAVPGTQSERLFGYAMFVGGLVGGGQVELGYARDALLAAGRAMRPGKKPWSAAEIDGHVARGLAKGETLPRYPEEREPRRTPRRGLASSERREASEEAEVLWAQGLSGWRSEVGVWLAGLGLTQTPPGDPRGRALAWLRRADRDLVVARLVEGWSPQPAKVEAIAAWPVAEVASRVGHVVGDCRRRAIVLCDPPGATDLLVALDLADGWALACAAAAEGWSPAVAIAPSLSAFAGGVLTDAYGRFDPDLPQADPADPPWLGAPARWEAVHLAVRGDLRSPPLKVRKALGGSHAVRIEGEAAARFYGGLAEQHWRAGGANAVRVIRPTQGVGFNPGGG